MPRSAASHLGLYCLPMSHKQDARLKRVFLSYFLALKISFFFTKVTVNYYIFFNNTQESLKLLHLFTNCFQLAWKLILEQKSISRLTDKQDSWACYEVGLEMSED